MKEHMMSITALAATEHTNDLLRAANSRRLSLVRADADAYASQSVVLVQVRSDDNDAVRRLAELDDAPGLEGSALLALVDGQPVAALSLEDGRVVADPFRFTTGPVSLLRLRADQLSSASTGRRLGATLRLRLAGARHSVAH
jgi:hypothetical protein